MDASAATQRDESPTGDVDRSLLRVLLENAEDYAVYRIDREGRIVAWNIGAQRLFGYRAKEIVGKSITFLIPDQRINDERLILRKLRRGERTDHYETVRRRKDGRLIDVWISIIPIRDARGRTTGAVKIVRDISQQKQSEACGRQDEQMLRAILDAANDAIIAIDERGIVQSANAATENLFGYAPAELVGQNINLLMPEPYHDEHDGYLHNYCRTGRAKIIGIGREVTGLRKDGSTFPMHLSVSQVKLRNRRLFTGIVHDLTERRRLERQIMETAANEQRRIGQDLHDGLCQDLVGIAFGIDTVARNVSADSNREGLKKIATSVRDAANLARRLAHGLNPVDLKAGGLSAALDALAIKVSDSFEVNCTFQQDQAAQVHDDATATHLYRIAQEAIGNAIRHGKADKVEISLADRGGVTLSVSDNGKGIPESVSETVKKGLVLNGPNGSPPAGMGLQTMHYRARVMGGTFAVAPRKDGGTIVSCRIGRELSPPGGKNAQLASGKDRSIKRRLSR